MGTEREGWRIEPYNFERKREESKVLRLLVKKKKDVKKMQSDLFCSSGVPRNRRVLEIQTACLREDSSSLL